MKLKFLCMELSGTGGTETVLVKVLNELCATNEIELILTNHPKQNAFLEKLNHKITVTYATGKIGKLAKITNKFVFASDDTYVISLSPKMLKLGAKIRQVLHKNYKLVSWIHFSLDDQDMFDAKSTVPLADLHLALNSTIKEQLLSYGVAKDKIFLVYNPIEPSAKVLEKGSAPRFFYAGRVIFAGQKNLKEMFDALKLYPEATLDIYGTGEDLSYCQEYTKKIGVSKQITWHGFVDDLWAKFQEKPTALLLTSTYEGLPMIVLEAIAHGIPVISSDFNGYQDVVKPGSNGYVYSLGDPKELAQKMKELYDHPLSDQDIKKSITPFYPKNYFEAFTKALQSLEK